MDKKLSCFIIMPYSKVSDMVYSKVILPALESLPDYKIIALRADQMNLSAITLKEHVDKSIAAADFIIADLTGFNPNVMYELGYASVLKIPILRVINGLPEKKPISIQDSLLISYDLEDLSLFNREISYRIRDLAKLIEGRRALVYSESIHEIKCYNSGELVDFKKLIQFAEHKIDILDLDLSNISRLYLDDLYGILREKENMKIRIVSLDPDSDIAARLAKMLGFSPYHYRKLMRESLETLIQLSSNFQNNLSIRVCDELFTQVMYRFDNTLIVTFNSSVRISRQNIHIIFDTNQSGVRETFIDNFLVMWNRGVPFI